jgi:CubicO group peptidase (beta-lactamase class C family)
VIAPALLLATGCEQAPTRPLRHLGPAPAGAVVDVRARCLAEHADVDPAWEPVVRALCADLHNLEGVGAAIAVVERGRVSFSLAAGRRCDGDEDPVRTDTLFRIGSVSKVVTAAAALTLVQDGGLAFERRVVDDLPGFRLGDPRAARAITLAHLLTHTSGLPEPSPARIAAEPGPWYEALRTEAPWFEPGTLWSYSNTGYALLGSWLEAVTGEPFASVVDQRVLEPLALADLTFDRKVASATGRAACGHLGRGRARTRIDVADDDRLDRPGVAEAGAAGAAFASAEELARLGAALLEDQALLEPAMRHAMFDTRVDTGGAPGEYWALGIGGWTATNGQAVFHHAGNTGDFSADLWLVPHRQLVVVLLANGPAHFPATARAAFEAAGADDALDRPDPGPPRPTGAYVGEYAVAGWPEPIHVRAGAGGPVLDAPALRVLGLTLRPVAGDAFSVTWPALQSTERVDFVFDARGTFIRSRWFVGRRAPSLDPRSPPG